MRRVTERVSEMLADVQLGTIVAVWRDGSVSVHRSLGFRYRTLPDGTRDEPLTSFVKDIDVPSLAEIQVRVQRALGMGTAPKRE